MLCLPPPETSMSALTECVVRCFRRAHLYVYVDVSASQKEPNSDHDPYPAVRAWTPRISFLQLTKISSEIAPIPTPLWNVGHEPPFLPAYTLSSVSVYAAHNPIGRSYHRTSAELMTRPLTYRVYGPLMEATTVGASSSGGSSSCNLYDPVLNSQPSAIVRWQAKTAVPA